MQVPDTPLLIVLEKINKYKKMQASILSPSFIFKVTHSLSVTNVFIAE